MLSSHMIVGRSDNALSSDTGEEIILLHQERGEYFSLTDLGKDIWKMLEEPKSVEAITTTILAEYDVEENELKSDLNEFLSQMIEEDIFQTSG